MPNRLAASSSPYLLQHRHNPVDWYPWGDEAIEMARTRDVPIFLSIGYSTCYWCHVMERECFENESIAQLMNEHFVCIKVDREERPDVDDIYMAAVQAFTGHGGWPMSVFLEPGSLKPFWAGTYLPPQPYPGMGDRPSFPQVLTALSEAYRTQRAEVLQQSAELADAVRERTSHAAAPVAVGEREVSLAAAQLLKLHDPVHGGFGPAPKFPQPAFLDLLLAVRAAAGDDDTRAAVDHALRTTLTRMALGGIFDHVGGGFHRYSVDAQWIVPHFEKMLYDNGALASVYAEAASLYGDALFARTARRICASIQREMTAPDGAFFSAQDAEVNHREGQNYLWTREQLVGALGEDDGAWAARLYSVERGFNFRDPHHPGDPPANVLCIDPAALPGNDAAWSDPAFLRRFDSVNARLYEARTLRDQPSTDTKVIAGWNGLMIAGLARTGALLKEPGFIQSARAAADFVLFRMRDGAGDLLRVFSKSRAAIPAFLEDYALLTHGLLALHRAAPDSGGTYIEAALELTARARAHFGDEHGAFYDTRANQADLFVRTRSIYDGAMPCGTSVVINNLVELAAATGDRAYARVAAQALAAASGSIAASPLAAANSLRALLRLMALDRPALDLAFHGAPAPANAAAPDADFTPVEILSAVERVAIPEDQPIGIVLRITIAPGYHVNAAIPNDPNLIPFKVHVVNGTGIAVYADYPDGAPSGANGEIRVYSGVFELPIVLERSGQWTGTPLLAVTYQACTDEACLAPRTVELDVELERA